MYTIPPTPLFRKKIDVYLEEDDKAGDPEAGKEGVVDEVEHCDLQPWEGGSAIMQILKNFFIANDFQI